MFKPKTKSKKVDKTLS